MTQTLQQLLSTLQTAARAYSAAETAKRERFQEICRAFLVKRGFNPAYVDAADSDDLVLGGWTADHDAANAAALAARVELASAEAAVVQHLAGNDLILSDSISSDLHQLLLTLRAAKREVTAADEALMALPWPRTARDEGPEKSAYARFFTIKKALVAASTNLHTYLTNAGDI